MKEPYKEAIGEILSQVRDNIWASEYQETFSIEQITGASKFINDCTWAIEFGSTFQEEIIQVVNEVLLEGE